MRPHLFIVILTVWAVLVLGGMTRGGDLRFVGPPQLPVPPGAIDAPVAQGAYPGMQPIYPGSQYGNEEAFDNIPNQDKEPIWSVSVETMLLKRSGPKFFPLIVAGTHDPNGLRLLTTDDLTFDHELAARFNAVIHQTCGLDVGINFFKIDSWSAEGVGTNPTGISAFVPNRTFSTFTAGRFKYASDLWSAELNLRWRVCPCLTLLAGLRFMELREDFFHDDNFQVQSVFGPSIAIHTKNKLAGFQIGALGTLLQLGKQLSLDGYLKAGYFNNHAEHEMAEFQNFAPGPLAAKIKDTSTVVELGLVATLHFGKNAKVWFGYQLMWMQGIATAPSQTTGNDLIRLANPGATRLGPVGAVGVDTYDNLFFDGATGGFELSF